MIKRNVFLGEDDDDDLLIFADAILELHPYINLIHLRDGEELMSALYDFPKIQPGDVLFLDINMPKKNGRECLTEIRRAARFDNLTIAVVSTETNPVEIRKLLNHGANFFIPKLQDFRAFKDQVISSITKEWDMSSQQR